VVKQSFILWILVIGAKKNIWSWMQKMLVSCLGAGRGFPLPAMGRSLRVQSALKSNSRSIHLYVSNLASLSARFEGKTGKSLLYRR